MGTKPMRGGGSRAQRLRAHQLRELVKRLVPGGVLLDHRPLAPDVATSSRTAKAKGYGEPLRLHVRDAEGKERMLVFRTASANDYGHDRRSDRAQQILLCYDTFDEIPSHVRALEVGAIGADGALTSLNDAGELYLVTSYAPGDVYAGDLRRIAEAGEVGPLDVDRCDALARWLLGLHVPLDRPAAWTRAVRDLVGHGEGIFGVVDGYPPDVPAAPPARLAAIERACLGWRWRLKGEPQRLRRTHGDFHPFNVVFGDDADFTVLDASRGCLGDAADDVTCMAINYVFFALERPRAWRSGLGVLWRRFWRLYLEETPDHELLRFAAPFLAWRALVLASPSFYPGTSPDARDKLLGWVERILASPRFDPESAESLFP